MFSRFLALISARRAREQNFDRLVAAGRAHLGRHSYTKPNVRTFGFDSVTKLRIGNFCSIAGDVVFLLGGNHPTNRLTTFPIRDKFHLSGAGRDGFPCSKGDIVVGNDVWIGYGATIVSGVTIGHGAVVAAGAVVVKDVPPFAIVAGSPAKVVRFRLNEDQIGKALQLAWWDWTDEKIASNVQLLCDWDSGSPHFLSEVKE